MEKTLYFVYALDEHGYLKGEKRVTDEEHLETCAKYVKHDFGVEFAHYNKCSFCFDGYLVQGDYCGKL